MRSGGLVRREDRRGGSGTGVGGVGEGGSDPIRGGGGDGGIGDGAGGDESGAHVLSGGRWSGLWIESARRRLTPGLS